MQIKNILKSVSAIIVVSLLAFLYISMNLPAQVEEKESTPVEVYNIPNEPEDKEEIESTQSITKTGLIQSDIQVTVLPLVAGTLENLNLQEGDTVSKNQVIGNITNSPQLDSATASLASANESLAILQQIIAYTSITNTLDLDAFQNQITAAEISINSVEDQIFTNEETSDIQEELNDTQQDSQKEQILIQEKQREITELQKDLQELQIELQQEKAKQASSETTNSETTNEKIDDIEDEIADIEDEIDDLTYDIYDSTDNINDNSLDLSELQYDLQKEQLNLQSKQLKNQLKSIENQIDQLNTQLQSSEIKGEIGLLNLQTQVVQLMGQINQTAITLNTGNIIAPISGTITKIYVDNGQQISQSSVVVEITNLDLVNIEVGLTSKELNQIKNLPQITLNIEDQEIKANISKISKIADPTTRNILVTLTPQDNSNLIINTLVDVEFSEEKTEYEKVPVKKTQKIKVDQKIIIHKNDKEYLPVYKNGEVVYRLVSYSKANSDGEVTINAGLKSGDQLIISPRYPIEGSKVRISKELD